MALLDRTPTTFQSISPGNVAWSNLQNVVTDDNNPATVQLGKDQEPLIASFTNFNFSSDNRLLSSAKINGIQLILKRRFTKIQGNNIPIDQQVSLTIGGQNKALASNWTTSYTTVTYGSSSDLWGNSTISQSQIINPDFGVLIDVAGNGGGNQLEIDYLRLSINFQIKNIHMRSNATWQSATALTKSGSFTPREVYVRSNNSWVLVHLD